jgi:nucleoside-diphosphate-sugar epimerase
MRLLIWGAGELGGRVGALWVQRGELALGLTRSTDRHEALRHRGIEPRIASAASLLEPDDSLLLALPGSANQQAAVETLTGLPPPARAVLISSTAYYGMPHGRVDEDTPAGSDERARAAAAAERLFHAWAGNRGVIMRLGGLYGPGRGPFAALLRRGSAPVGPPDRTLALIHYDDAATATLGALRHAAPEPIYVGVVPPCPTRREFYEAACRLAGLPEPAFEAPLNLPLAAYDVTRLRRDLLPTPTHPDWRQSLQQP